MYLFNETENYLLEFEDHFKQIVSHLGYEEEKLHSIKISLSASRWKNLIDYLKSEFDNKNIEDIINNLPNWIGSEVSPEEYGWIVTKKERLEKLKLYILDEYNKFAPKRSATFIEINKSFNRNEVVKILFNTLSEKYIKVNYENFNAHFDKQARIEQSKIKWEKDERLIVAFFELLANKNYQNKGLIININLYQTIENHFLNKKRNKFNNHQLATTSSQIGNADSHLKKNAPDLLECIETLKKLTIQT